MSYSILLVYDDQDVREKFSDYLSQYQVIETSDEEEALNLLQRPNEIDLVILDIMAPGLRETEILKKMKEMSPDLGIIILTGDSLQDMVIRALKGHADEYIERPFHIDQTKKIIERLLNSKEGTIDLDSGDVEGKIERVKRYLERNYNKKVSLKIASETVYLSPKYLSRIFKHRTGIKFNEYKLKIKTEKGKEFLDQGGYNINQIAYKLGYKNTESFMRLFKKNTGYTPTEYRKKEKQKRRQKDEPKRAILKTNH